MLIDKLREIALHDQDQDSPLSPQVKRGIGEATAVVIDNVAKYYMQDNNQEVWNLTEDFPNISPPWPTMSFEWVPAEYVNSIETGFYPNPQRSYAKREALIILTMETKVAMEEPFIKDYATYHRFMYAYALSKNPNPGKLISLDTRKVIYKDIRESWNRITESQKEIIFAKMELSQRRILEIQISRGIRWNCAGYYFVERRDGFINLAAAINTWGVSEDGKFLGVDPDNPEVPILHFQQDISAEESEFYVKNAASFLHIPFLALSLLHCKNIAVKEVLPEPKTNKLRKSKGKEPLAKYYTLLIDPMKEILRKEGSSTKTGLKKALHICRGHFATYGADKPLFGKVVGTFFKPMHRRGSMAAGAVIKNYKMGKKNQRPGQ